MQAVPLESHYLLQLLSTAIEGSRPQCPPEGLDWEKLYKIAVWHGVSNIAFYGIDRLENHRKSPQEVMMKFHCDFKKAIAKEATQHIAVEQLLKAFEENNILCMPLKGYLVKYLYPRPDMRMMADVDILFKNKQTEQVKNLMLESGFTLEDQGGSHDIYYKKPFLNIEMHRTLICEESPYSNYLNKTWCRAKLKDGCKFIYELSHEDFYIYLLIHLTKHYTGGGTGIRSFLDIRVYYRRYAKEMNWDYIWSELEKISLREFAGNILGLCEVWFGNARSNQLYDEMTQYIFSSGVYGTRKHAVISSINIKSGSKHSIWASKQMYRLRLFFPPLNKMKVDYPFVQLLPVLLPVCWVLRGIRCLLFKRRHTFQMINNLHSVSEEDLVWIGSLHEKSGLFR